MLGVGRAPAMPSSGTISTVPLLPVLALPASLPAPRLAAAPALGWWLKRLAIVLRKGELLGAPALLLGSPVVRLCMTSGDQCDMRASGSGNLTRTACWLWHRACESCYSNATVWQLLTFRSAGLHRGLGSLGLEPLWGKGRPAVAVLVQGCESRQQAAVGPE